ncbi:MAG: helix-turn-helix domain-containing protein [Bacillota bacterium]
MRENQKITELQFYTAPEVAKILRIKKGYVYELIATGRLHAIKLSERRIRIPKNAILEFTEKEIGRG